MTASNESCSPSLLTGDIFTIIHLLEHQTANWDLSARNGDYKLVIRWKKSRQYEEQTESPTLQKTRKRSSKARTDRNKRRLEAFIAKKSTPSTTENGEPAQEKRLENDPDVDPTNNTEENGEYTAQPTEEMTTQEQPLVTVLKDDRKLSCTPHKDPACTKGAEGQLSANYAGMETSERTTRYRIGKITLDLPQKTFLFEVEKENSFILVYSDKLDPYKLIEKEKEPTFYDAIKRSHDHWLDVRDKRNFLYSEERKLNIEEVAKKNNFKLRTLNKIKAI
ncbi:unnamed protein product [Mytilus coruscus]|uniref:Uncharacterized protein n=1 Tax=Mytilus coruscus TaxID=42192 RepID=A0A6J8ABW3_MYTCO|nr:unnamed protein product [Mytilus coruscus]